MLHNLNQFREFNESPLYNLTLRKRYKLDDQREPENRKKEQKKQKTSQ